MKSSWVNLNSERMYRRLYIGIRHQVGKIQMVHIRMHECDETISATQIQAKKE